MVLADGKVLYQYQEVAAVYTETREVAYDMVELVEVDYEPLEVVTDPYKAMKDDVLLRPDRDNRTNPIYNWNVGDSDATDSALKGSEVVIREYITFPRVHAAPLEPCGCIAEFDAMGRLQFYVISQAPHVYRTALFMVLGIPEDKIRVISPDLGGGLGNKVLI